MFSGGQAPLPEQEAQAHWRYKPSLMVLGGLNLSSFWASNRKFLYWEIPLPFSWGRAGRVARKWSFWTGLVQGEKEEGDSILVTKRRRRFLGMEERLILHQPIESFRGSRWDRSVSSTWTECEAPEGRVSWSRPEKEQIVGGRMKRPNQPSPTEYMALNSSVVFFEWFYPIDLERSQSPCYFLIIFRWAWDFIGYSNGWLAWCRPGSIECFFLSSQSSRRAISIVVP